MLTREVAPICSPLPTDRSNGISRALHSRWDHIFGTYPKDSYQEKADDLEAKAEVRLSVV